MLIAPLKPKPQDKVYNLTLLWYMSRMKSRYKGTYYIPHLNILIPVFEVDDWNQDLARWFHEINPSILNKGYKMICLPHCGACCEFYSGAFMFEEEAKECDVLDYLKNQRVRIEEVTLLNGVKTRIYSLSVGVRKSCLFYDWANRSCRINSCKPIICLISYCSFVAIKNSRIYVKTCVKGGKAIYKPWSGNLESLIKLVRSVVRPI